MGEIADMVLDGILDEQIGEYIGNAVGYPRTKEKGFYNTIKNPKCALKKQNLGGTHLIGKTCFTEKQGMCRIINITGKRDRKKYVLIDINKKEHNVKFSMLSFK